MSSPTSVEEFLALLLKSGLVDSKQLSGCLEGMDHESRPRTPRAMAEFLRRNALLSNYQAMQLLRGKWDQFRVGPYTIVDRLGSGEVSNVYLCERPVTRARVAVKLLAALQAADPTVVQRFYREARAAASLIHPNIVRAYDVDKDEQGHFMVMDFIDGSSLQDIVQQLGPMDPIRSAHYIRQAALGLQYAHEKGLVHRDVKPANLLIDRQGTVKILDMGLARFSQEEGGVLTRGVVLGSPEYLAPEQGIDSHNVDTRADVYGLGATCYYLLTGQPPYAEEKTIAGKLTSKQTRDPAPILMLRGEVPEELAAVVEKAMCREPARRYPTPGAVAEALAPWTQTAIPPPSDSEMPQLGTPALGNERPDREPIALASAAKKLPVQKLADAPARPFGDRSATHAIRQTASPPKAAAPPPRPGNAPPHKPDPVTPAAPKTRRKKQSRRRRRSRVTVQAMALLLLGVAAAAIGWLVFFHRN